MQLSKQESKYRYKLFYERGYKKQTQQDIDYYIKTYNSTYKQLYSRVLLPDVIMMSPSKSLFKATSRVFKKLGISIKDMNSNFKNFSDILSELSEKWNETQGNNKKESSL